MPGPEHIRLSELNTMIQQAINNTFNNTSFWVIADITNHTFRPQKNYHNFDFVEKDITSHDIIAKVSGNAWAAGSIKIAGFEKTTGQRFTNNINVLVKVAVKYHPVHGLKIELVDIDPYFTLGLLIR